MQPYQTLIAIALAVTLIILGDSLAITWLFLAAVFLAAGLLMTFLAQITQGPPD